MSEIDFEQDTPYRIRDVVFTDSEKKLMTLLIKKFSGRYFVMPKLPFSELFRVNKPNENILFVQKLGGKTVDFVLFSQESFVPVAAIELDDPKQRQHAIGSKLIDEICTQLGFPIVHITRSLDLDQIEWDMISKEIEAYEKTHASGESPSIEFSPICPNCGITMVLRFDHEGPIKGQKYYGCLNFPECENKIAIEVEV